MGICMSSIRSKSEGTPSSGSSPQEKEFLKALAESRIKGKTREKDGIKYSFDIIPWNLRCAPKPLAVVYPLTPGEISVVVKVAAKHGIPVQPRSGGHSYGSYSLGGKDGALVVDLSKLNTVIVDQKTWRATVGAGTKLKDVTDGLYSQGKRTIAHGVCPQVGIGGHATVGGQGPLSRLYGLTLDHMIEAEVVLADGSITRANEEINSDLFFAIRGAGASFCIVTSFIFETHPAPEVTTHYSYQLKYGSHEELADIFLQWQEFISSPVVLNDRAFNSVIGITNGIIVIQGSRIGSKSELEASEVYISMKNKFTVDVTTRELEWLDSIIHWAEESLLSLGGGVPLPLYMKSLSVKQSKPLTPEAVKAWFEYMHKHSPDDSVCIILADLEGGRISDHPLDSTAYCLRESLYTMCAHSIAKIPYPDDTLAYLNGMIDTITTRMPDGEFCIYPGYVDPLLPKSQWPKLYWGDNYTRLLEIKKKYDKDNVFSNPQSVGADQPPPPKPAFTMVDGTKPVLNLVSRTYTIGVSNRLI